MDTSPTELEISESALGFKEMQRIKSNNGLLTGIIGQRTDGSFSYSVFCWDLSDYEYIGEGYWSSCDIGGFYQDLKGSLVEAQRYIETHDSKSKI